jgi:signal peptidase II
LALLAADQYTKRLAVRILLPEGVKPFIPGLFDFTYVENKGAAFGLLEGGRWVFLGLTAVVLAVIARFYINPPSAKPKLARAAMAAVAAGAIGNAVDRFRNGFVVDFIHAMFIEFPVFNVADMCIVCGAILLAALALFYGEAPKRRDAGHDDADGLPS